MPRTCREAIRATTAAADVTVSIPAGSTTRSGTRLLAAGSCGGAGVWAALRVATRAAATRASERTRTADREADIDDHSGHVRGHERSGAWRGGQRDASFGM